MLDVRALQARLGVIVDGDDGPATWGAVFKRLGASTVTAPLLGLSASVNLRRYDIHEPLRIVHLLGQTLVETSSYRYLREIWGPTKQQLGYEGRQDLGNSQPGDGQRYAGRGVLQVTGRRNYRAVSRKMGIDVEAQPELLERADVGFWAACIWWTDNGANAWADRDDAKAVSRLVNRGNARADSPANHEAERIVATNRVRRLIT